MNNYFRLNVITGKGRGKKLGFPTINLAIPKKFSLKDGIYAAWVIIGDKKYLGAVHHGSVPTFNQKEKSFEVNIVDSSFNNMDVSIYRYIDTEIIKYIRPIIKFNTSTELVAQIRKDVAIISEYANKKLRNNCTR